MLTNPTYRQNVATFALLYIAGGGIGLAVSLPYAVKYGYWRSILWSPTWFIFAFLRRLATLEATISLPGPALPRAAAAREEGQRARAVGRGPAGSASAPGRARAVAGPAGGRVLVPGG